MERPSWAALHDMVGDLERTVSKFDSMQQRMTRITGEGRSEDRMIRAVVGPRGQLVDLEIDPRIYRKPDSRALAAAIIEAVRLAIADAGQQAQRLIEEHIPSDMRSVRPAGGIDLVKLIQTPDADLRKDTDDDG
jgi:hypothetical protein